MNESNFNDIFKELKTYLQKYEKELVVVYDRDTSYYLDSKKLFPRNNKPYFFGSVSIKKNYVSYYLMPVYMFPDLLDTITPNLKARMQGKSCFNFIKFDEQLFNELKHLTADSFKRFKEKELI